MNFVVGEAIRISVCYMKWHNGTNWTKQSTYYFRSSLSPAFRQYTVFIFGSCTTGLI